MCTKRLAMLTAGMQSVPPAVIWQHHSRWLLIRILSDPLPGCGCGCCGGGGPRLLASAGARSTSSLSSHLGGRCLIRDQTTWPRTGQSTAGPRWRSRRSLEKYFFLFLDVSKNDRWLVRCVVAHGSGTRVVRVCCSLRSDRLCCPSSSHSC